VPAAQPRRPALLLAVVAVGAAVACTGGCRGVDRGDELVLVERAPTERDPAAPAQYTLLARVEAHSAGSAGARGGAELWVPLPATDAYQSVDSLAVEVAPPGVYELAPADGEGRVLHTTAPSVVVRARIERPRVDASTPLPPDLAGLPPDPAAWVDAARARGAEARLALGLDLRPDGETVQSRWPEVKVGDAWTPVDPVSGRATLPLGRVRLAGPPARATVDGQAADVQADYTLTRRR
jgi:hypothetical protein